ncbi:MAG: hypothetical protein RBG13Loki_1410 [Promethearchaeota archaeon CR_4]|nr:MAG: hypothetical protein RBG13Loki_1410 [Candidatus Lokiarchaeota archaeon CR_4]
MISQEKCMKILKLLELNVKGCQLTEMARQLGMHYYTIKKYVSKLEQFDLVFSKSTKVYFIDTQRMKEILDAPMVTPTE